MERWKTYEKYDMYEVSTEGRVRNRTFDESINISTMSTGVVYVCLNIDGWTEFYRLDEMVAETFLGPRPSPTNVVMHKDKNMKNCSLNNLKWTHYMNVYPPKHIPYSTRVRCEQNGMIYDNLYICSEELGISLRKIVNSIHYAYRAGVTYEYTFEVLDPIE